MEEKNKHIRYYILFDNHTQGMMLHELLDKQGLPNRIAPAPRDTDGKAACGMALLIHPDDIDAVRTCIEENHAEYVNIVPLENLFPERVPEYFSPSMLQKLQVFLCRTGSRTSDCSR